MASSSSPPSQRRRPLRKRQSLSRNNSSFLGAIKSLVTAPLSWFTGTGDFEDSKDLQGKRRRLVVAPIEPDFGEDDRLSRNKRMRIHSPLRDESFTSPPPSNGYLDPPGSAFQQQQQQQQPSNHLIQPKFTRSASVTNPYDFHNNNNNSIRVSTPSRTMSIDPPARPLSRLSSVDLPAQPLTRSYAMSYIPAHGDVSMESSKYVRAVPRDMSMPPLSSRPSFRMRTSLTPQPPPPRETSEPPPITSLKFNPTFIRPPVKTRDPPQNGLSRQPSATLGTLVESVRSTRSPVRQHSSLLFGHNEGRPSHSEPLKHYISPDIQRNPGPNLESAVEKALHELDIYKTPLVPTRLRSSNIPLTSTSLDLFKSRRTSKLVLMQDDKRTSHLGRKAKGAKDAPVVNETKPYAGEGGMKKLLARRKQEAEQDIEITPLEKDEDYMDDSVGAVEKNVDKVGAALIVPPLPPPAMVDVFAINSVPKSSLRVGRTKVRGHITRPTRPTKTTFSAAFDDDGMDDIEDMDEETNKKRKEKEALEEAAKHVPVFQIPEGFSFAKETNAINLDSAGAKEPPIKTLPFSITKPPTIAPVEVQTSQQNALTPVAQKQVPASTSSEAKKIFDPPYNSSEATLATPAVQASKSSSAFPNFFASSSILAKPIELPTPSPLFFSTPSAMSEHSLPARSKDADNPLWTGEAKKTEPIASFPTLAGGLNIASSVETASHISSLNVGSAFPLVSRPVYESAMKADLKPDIIPHANPFSKPAEFSDESINSGAVKEPSSSESAPTTQPPGVLKPSGLFGDQPKTSPPLQEPVFGSNASKPAGPFVESSKATASASAPAPFSFAPSAPTINATKLLSGTASTLDAPPQSLFGDSGFSFGSAGNGKVVDQKPESPFSFGNVGSNKDTKSEPINLPFAFGNTSNGTNQKPTGSPFTLGAAPIAHTVEPSKSTPFSFASAPSATTAAPTSTGFSFSGGGSNASDVSSKPFTFGQPNIMPPTGRPSTPPRSQDQEISMEESPTRDTQINKPVERPILGASRFSFGSSTPEPGPSASTASSGPLAPFSFGPSSTMNSFSKDSKSAENKPFAGFGQVSASSTGFSFGQPKSPDNEPPRPNTTGPFTFGSTPTSATGSGTAFGFGGPSNNSSSTVFGQPQSGSAPGSPSIFSQASPFNFGAPLPPVSTGFSFGSQPASPAGGNTTNLPQSTTLGGFGSAGGQQSASPFGAPAGATSTLFTIGSAPTAAPSAGARQIRKLPNRRGTGKR